MPTEAEFTPYHALAGTLVRVPDTGPWAIYEAAGARRLLLILCGVGPANAAAATERLVALYRPAAILHGGAAGAHMLDLLPGDVVVGTRYVQHISRADQAAREHLGFGPKLVSFFRHGERVRLPCVEADPALLQLALNSAEEALAGAGDWQAAGWPDSVPRRPARAVAGTIATGDFWTVDGEELAYLRGQFGAECEDMESVYVAQVCAMHAVPFLAVRAISNNDALQGIRGDDVMPAIGAAGARAAQVLVAVARAVCDA